MANSWGKEKKQKQVGLNPQMAAAIFFFSTEAIVPILKEMAHERGKVVFFFL